MLGSADELLEIPVTELLEGAALLLTGTAEELLEGISVMELLDGTAAELLDPRSESGMTSEEEDIGMAAMEEELISGSAHVLLLSEEHAKKLALTIAMKKHSVTLFRLIRILDATIGCIIQNLNSC